MADNDENVSLTDIETESQVNKMCIRDRYSAGEVIICSCLYYK